MLLILLRNMSFIIAANVIFENVPNISYLQSCFLFTTFCFPTQEIMSMNNILATVAYCLLATSLAVAKSEKENFTLSPTATTLDSNMTFVTSTNSTTVFSNVTVNTSVYTTTTQDSGTVNETTSHTQTSPSTNTMTPQTHSTSEITTAGTHTHTPPSPGQTTPATQSTTDTTAVTTAYSSHTVYTNTDSEDKTTQGKHQTLF